MSNYKLTYFTSQAIGEGIRMLLSYGKIDFEDVRINFFTEWADYKEKHKNDLPLLQVPILEVDGKKMFQSIAICRFLAKKVGLNGGNEMEDYEIDCAVDTIDELRAKCAEAFYESDAELKEKYLKELKATSLPFLANKLEGMAQKGDGYFALGKLTWADVYFASKATYFHYMTGEDITVGRPFLKKNVEIVNNQPGIREWIAKRPKSVEEEVLGL